MRPNGTNESSNLKQKNDLKLFLLSSITQPLRKLLTGFNVGLAENTFPKAETFVFMDHKDLWTGSGPMASEWDKVKPHSIFFDEETNENQGGCRVKAPDRNVATYPFPIHTPHLTSSL